MHHRICGPRGPLVALRKRAASAAPVTVNLRVEGTGATVYEGAVTTDGKRSRRPTGGAHMCDGTNGGRRTPRAARRPPRSTTRRSQTASPGTGADSSSSTTSSSSGSARTARSALRHGQLLGPHREPGSRRCRRLPEPVNDGDEVLLDVARRQQAELSSSPRPRRRRRASAFDVGVQQYGGDGVLAPAAGASVAGQLTGGDGHATVTFASAGVQHLKATRGDAVRSNDADVCVYVPGSGDCRHGQRAQRSTTGHRAPSITLGGPRDGASYKRGPRVLKGTAQRRQVAVPGLLSRLRRRLARRRASWFSAKSASSRSVDSRNCDSARFLRIGHEAQLVLPAAGTSAGGPATCST